MTLVSQDTAKRATTFVAAVEGAKRRRALPGTYRDFTPVEKSAPVLEISSALSHMDIVTSGKVLPVLLHRSPLKSLKPPRFVRPKPNPYQDPQP